MLFYSYPGDFIFVIYLSGPHAKNNHNRNKCYLITKGILIK